MDDPDYATKVTVFNNRTDNDIEITDITRAIPAKSRPILKLNRETGAIIDIYKNAKQAANKNNLKWSTSIHAVCNKTVPSTGGFKWCYADDIEYEAKLARFKRKQSKEDGPPKKEA